MSVCEHVTTLPRSLHEFIVCSLMRHTGVGQGKKERAGRETSFTSLKIEIESFTGGTGETILPVSTNSGRKLFAGTQSGVQ